MAKTYPQLKAELRTVTGRKVKRLRRDGWTPATVYGKEMKPLTIQVNSGDLVKLYDEEGESGLVELLIDDQTLPILFKNPQYHPTEDNLLHIDFHKVNLKEKITATVPIELIGESPAVKAGKILVQISDEVEVEALPTDLPEKFEVDISKLEMLDQMITVADLKVDTGKVEIKTDTDQVIVKLEEPKEEEVIETEVAPEEVPATEQKGEEEGAPVEDGKAEEEKKEE